MGLKATVEKRHGFIWVILPDTLTVENHRDVEDAVISELTGNGDKLVLDLSDTEEIYSSGIGMMIRLRKAVHEADGSIALVNVSKKSGQLLESMRLEKVFPMYATDVEFEMSQEDVWIREFREKDIGFIFAAQVENGVYQISISGHMDALHDLLPVSEWQPEQTISHYLVNLESLEAMDTYGAQVFLDFVQRLGKRGGKCVAYGANEMVQELLKLLSIDQFIEHFATEDEAMSSVNG